MSISTISFLSVLLSAVFEEPIWGGDITHGNCSCLVAILQLYGYQNTQLEN